MLFWNIDICVKMKIPDGSGTQIEAAICLHLSRSSITSKPFPRPISWCPMLYYHLNLSWKTASGGFSSGALSHTMRTILSSGCFRTYPAHLNLCAFIRIVHGLVSFDWLISFLKPQFSHHDFSHILQGVLELTQTVRKDLLNLLNALSSGYRVSKFKKMLSFFCKYLRNRFIISTHYAVFF